MDVAQTLFKPSIKIHASRYDRFLKSIFYILLVVEAFSLQKVVKMLEEVVVGRMRSGECGR